MLCPIPAPPGPGPYPEVDAGGGGGVTACFMLPRPSRGVQFTKYIFFSGTHASGGGGVMQTLSHRPQSVAPALFEKYMEGPPGNGSKM